MSTSPPGGSPRSGAPLGPGCGAPGWPPGTGGRGLKVAWRPARICRRYPPTPPGQPPQPRRLVEWWAVELEAGRQLAEAHPSEFDTLLDGLEQAAVEEPCPACLDLGRRDVALAACLGHDRRGHRVARALRVAGYRTIKKVRAASDTELEAVEGLGPPSVEWIRYAFGVAGLVRAREHVA